MQVQVCRVAVQKALNERDGLRGAAGLAAGGHQISRGRDEVCLVNIRDTERRLIRTDRVIGIARGEIELPCSPVRREANDWLRIVEERIQSQIRLASPTTLSPVTA